MAEDDDGDETAAYAARISRVVLTASDALQRGDVAFAGRLLALFAGKIRRGVAKAQAERDARATRH